VCDWQRVAFYVQPIAGFTGASVSGGNGHIPPLVKYCSLFSSVTSDLVFRFYQVLAKNESKVLLGSNLSISQHSAFVPAVRTRRRTQLAGGAPTLTNLNRPAL
jgi:hypothetical protein